MTGVTKLEWLEQRIVQLEERVALLERNEAPMPTGGGVIPAEDEDQPDAENRRVDGA